MMRLLVGVVVAGVVAADHAPAGLIGRVAVRPVQQVGMIEERIARLHLDVDQGKALDDLFDPVPIGAGLPSGEHVVDPAQAVRALDHLEAAVLPGARIDGYENADQVGKEDAILVPVALILVPGPGTADFGNFHDHLRVIMVDLVVEDVNDVFA